MNKSALPANVATCPGAEYLGCCLDQGQAGDKVRVLLRGAKREKSSGVARWRASPA